MPHAPAGHQRLNLESLAETPVLARHTGRLFLGLEQVLVPHGVWKRRLPRNGRGEQGGDWRQFGEPISQAMAAGVADHICANIAPQIIGWS